MDFQEFTEWTQHRPGPFRSPAEHNFRNTENFSVAALLLLLYTTAKQTAGRGGSKEEHP
jgi:hypothetical protein